MIIVSLLFDNGLVHRFAKIQKSSIQFSRVTFQNPNKCYRLTKLDPSSKCYVLKIHIDE